MSDRFTSSHPWRVTLRRPISLNLGALTVTAPRTGEETIIAPPTTIEIAAGEKMFRRKGDAAGCVTLYRRDHGDDVISDVYRVA